MSDRADLLQGTLDLLILKSLLIAPLHGWGISKRIRELSRNVLQVNQGSLYPALYRIEDAGGSMRSGARAGRASREVLQAHGRPPAESRSQCERNRTAGGGCALAIEHVLQGA